MKRDMDLVRQILLNATAEENGYANNNPEIEGFTEDQIGHHIYLMQQADLVKAVDTSALDSQSPTAMLISVTWKGHDFIEAARSNTVWSQAKDKAKSVGGSMTFDLMKELLVATARPEVIFSSESPLTPKAREALLREIDSPSAVEVSEATQRVFNAASKKNPSK